MAFVSINLADIQPGKFGKYELFKTIKDDLDDLDARVASNSAVALADDFNWSWDDFSAPGTPTFLSFEGNPLLDSGHAFFGTTPPYLFQGQDWRFYTDHQLGNGVKPHFSVGRVTLQNPTLSLLHASYGTLVSRLCFVETGIVDPLIFTARIKLEQDNDLIVGMYDEVLNRGITLVRSDATHWHFVASNSGGNTVTADFAAIFGSWVDVEIDFSSGSADCFINGSNKGPITTNLPTTEVLPAYVKFAIGPLSYGSDKHFDIDSAAYFPAGLVVAP